MPENMMARLASSPMTSGKTNVAPNMATTCWAPTPTVLPQGSRWPGATGSPGAGSTTSHLNIDMMCLFRSVRTRARHVPMLHMRHPSRREWCDPGVTGG